MAELILFHHIQGLTDGIKEFADRLRAAGHTVTTPDMYDGATFDSIDEGFAHARELGFEEIGAAEAAAAARLPADIVYAGFSMGAMAAHQLAQTRPGARGALLYHHGDVPIDTFGETWPKDVDLQIHINEHDEFCEIDVVREFVAKAGEQASAELFLYPGSAHLFADSSIDEYEAESAGLLIERTLAFLDSHG